MFVKNILQVLSLLSFALLLSCNDPVPPMDKGDEKLELFYYSKRNDINNIYKSDLQGAESPIIIDNNHHDWWVRVSPDRQTILWYKSPLDVPANDEFNNYDEAELWMANYDGSNPRKVIDLSDYNWSAQGVADWSPDGKELVMAATDESGLMGYLYYRCRGGKSTKNKPKGKPSMLIRVGRLMGKRLSIVPFLKAMLASTLLSLKFTL